MADDQDNEVVITVDDSSSSSSSISVAKESAPNNEAVAADQSIGVESAEGKDTSLRLLAMLTGAASIVDAGEQQLKNAGKKGGKYKKRESKKKDKGRAKRNVVVPVMEPCKDVSTAIAERPSTISWSKPETTVVHYIIPTVIEEYVSRAVSIITAELLSGTWWTSHHPNDFDEDGNVLPHHSLAPNSDPEPPVAHWMRFSQALHQFSKDVIVPSLIAHHVQDNQGRRAFLATCMMLRELLITNAEGVFYPSETPRAEFQTDNNTRSHRQMEAKEEQLFSNSIVVTAMIFAALQKLDDATELTNSREPSEVLCPPKTTNNDILLSDEIAPTTIANDSNTSTTESHSVPQIPSTEAKKSNASLCEDFASLLSDYHTLSGPFAAPATTAPYYNVDPSSPGGPNSPDADGDGRLPSLKRELFECLPRVDFRHGGVLPNGKSLGEQENLAWRVSYNIVRDRHFLSNTRLSQSGSTKHILMSSKRRKASCAIQRLIPPVANIAAVYMVERIDDDHQQRPSATESYATGR